MTSFNHKFFADEKRRLGNSEFFIVLTLYQ